MDAFVGMLMLVCAPEGFGVTAVGMPVMWGLGGFFDGMGDFQRLAEGKSDQSDKQNRSHGLSTPIPLHRRRV